MDASAVIHRKQQFTEVASQRLQAVALLQQTMTHVCQLSKWRFMPAAHVSLRSVKVHVGVMEELRIDDRL